MKKVLSLFLCVILILCLSACTYNPPDGYTEEHHTYEEILKFAKGIDPNATVSKEYTDTTIDAWNRKFREYPAIINGIECHVSSVGDMVWNEAGEFARQYYVIDTDYDYYLLEKITKEKQPTWHMRSDDLSAKYNWNGMVFVETDCSGNTKLSEEELETIWQQAYEIYKEYSKYPVRKEANFGVATPDVYYEDEHIKISSNYIDDFSVDAKSDFFKQYNEDWSLSESGLPTND
jgi:hypothetical protein